VDEPLLVRRREPLGHLAADADHLPERGPRVGPKRRVERHPLQQRHDDVREPLVVADVQDGGDVVVLDPGLRAGLADEPRLRLLVGGELREHDLQRDLALEPRVLGPVHRPHAPAAEFAEQHVLPEPGRRGGRGPGRRNRRDRLQVRGRGRRERRQGGRPRRIGVGLRAVHGRSGAGMRG
jgi:hypothetical protein